MKRARCGGSRGDVLPSSGGTPVWEPESVPSPASSMDAGGLLGSAAGRGGAGDDIHPLDADPGNEATAGTAADAFGSAPKRARAQPVANTEDAVVVDTIHARAAFAFLDRAAAVFLFGGAKLRDVQYAILRLPSSLKAAFGVGAVLHRLQTTDPVPFSMMYNEQLRASVDRPFLEGASILDTVQAMALHNVSATDDNPRCVATIQGVAGSGKTRVSFECLRLWDDSTRLRAVSIAVGGPVYPVRLSVDFMNGERWTAHDSLDMSENLGARLAAKALGVSLATVRTMNGASFNGLSVEAVLDALLQRAEFQIGRSSSAAAAAGDAATPEHHGVKPTFLIVVHTDEHQGYSAAWAADRSAQLSGSHAMPSPAIVQMSRVVFKEMLSSLNGFARSFAVQRRWRIILLPVVSGTPVLGVPMLATEKLQQRLLSPALLHRTSAEVLLASVLTYQAGHTVNPLNGHHDDVLRELRQGASRVAIGDTGFRPRLVVNLGDYVREKVLVMATRRRELGEENSAAASFLSKVDWKAARDACLESLRDRPGLVGTEKDILVKAALLRRPVRLDFPLGVLPGTDEEIALNHAEAFGLVDLEVAGHCDLRIVRMPLMQVMAWGTGDFIPPALTDVRDSWDWTYLERICAFIVNMRLRYMMQEIIPLSALLPGALCNEATRELNVVAPTTKPRVFVEQSKFITLVADVPEPNLGVQAAVVGERDYHFHELDEGVFCTCPGTALVDLRFSLRSAADCSAYVHFFVQVKHTTTGRTVNFTDVSEWHASIQRATTRWRSGSSRTVFVFVSNRRATNESELTQSSFFTHERSDLLVITRTELSVLLTPTLAHRGLLPPDNDAD
ncbi:hypothetical protein BU14_1791s0001 [Porphyra umbilicalis]|nr:hypothetical protein BU14_1791s0001 [Porphyra umbilicalis]|eukprot:OSX69156.1 hypothetical protein BU14_1791s0001 [Porphyra umbilicalis]